MTRSTRSATSRGSLSVPVGVAASQSVTCIFHRGAAADSLATGATQPAPSANCPPLLYRVAGQMIWRGVVRNAYQVAAHFKRYALRITHYVPPLSISHYSLRI